MKIAVTFFTIVKHYAGMPGMEVELSDDATLEELLREVGRWIGDKLPASIWDPQNEAFKRGILVFVNYEQVRDLNCPLRDGSQVYLAGAIAGG